MKSIDFFANVLFNRTSACACSTVTTSQAIVADNTLGADSMILSEQMW